VPNLENIISILMVGLIVIDVELDREYHDSIPATAIGSGLKPFDVRIDF
jgi:hypothetical protein